MNSIAHCRLCGILHLRLTSVVAATFGVLVAIVGVLSPIVQGQTAQVACPNPTFGLAFEVNV
jgi:hypothetical protein